LKKLLDIRSEDFFVICVVLAFLFIGFLNISHHEMWRDELQPWMVARDSSSINNLFENSRYERHPMLWPLGLFAISRFTARPEAMQVYHMFLAVIAVFIFVRFSPFTRLQKALFALGYFPLYEYAVISRCYVLGLIFVFAFCALFSMKPRNYLSIALVLFLLAQTSVFGLILSALFFAAILLEVLLNREVRQSIPWLGWKGALSVFFVAFGIAISALQMMPPAQVYMGMQKTAIEASAVERTISTIWGAYVPIPQLNIHFWNTNIIKNTTLTTFLSVILLIFSLSLFIRKPVALFLYSAGTAVLMAFFYSTLFGYLRHHGHFFILLLSCLWISSCCHQIKLKSAILEKLAAFGSRYRSAFLVALLVFNVVAAAAASGFDFVYPFSASKATARFIKNKKMANLALVGDADYAVSAVSGYLDKKFYYPRGDRVGSFIVWDVKREKLTKEEVLKRARDWMAASKKDALLVLNYKCDVPGFALKEVKKFPWSIVKDEKFFLYLMK
jgi:hypothetical protein